MRSHICCHSVRGAVPILRMDHLSLPVILDDAEILAYTLHDNAAICQRTQVVHFRQLCWTNVANWKMNETKVCWGMQSLVG